MNENLSALRKVAITFSPGLNNRLYQHMFERCGGIDGFFEEKETTIEQLFQEIGKKYSPLAREEWLLQAQEEWKIMQKEFISLCSIEDDIYPSLLKHCEDAPLVLFYKGHLPEADATTFAIVGTRKASERGKNRVNLLVKEIAEMGHQLSIISGLAYGIDVAAHHACLQYGLKTYAVLGHGLNTIYPAPHKHIAEKIIAQGGGLISEYPCQSKTLPINFLQRNRIVAGMSKATLVAESHIKGGAMATARQALSYNRDVIAIPGRPEDAQSSGCNLLIKQNIAALVDNTEDVLKIMQLEPIQPKIPQQLDLHFLPETEEEERIKQILSQEGDITIDQLQLLSNIPIATLSSLLLTMELEGKIIQLPGKTYSLC